jgi:hypothetical protein
MLGVVLVSFALAFFIATWGGGTGLLVMGMFPPWFTVFVVEAGMLRGMSFKFAGAVTALGVVALVGLCFVAESMRTEHQSIYRWGDGLGFLLGSFILVIGLRIAKTEGSR